MTTAEIITWGVRVVRWALVAYFGLFLYRRFKLPSLPWIGGYFIASWLPSLVLPFIIPKAVNSCFNNEKSIFQAASTLFKTNPIEYEMVYRIIKWTSVFNGIEYLLLTLLVISEVMFFVSSKTELTIPKPLAFTLSIRNKVNLVGILIVLIALISPIFTMIAVFRIPN